ncbi:MAG: type 1 glutamine amidotransferase domain-containing protein [Gammaproteobacteria bacterium]
MTTPKSVLMVLTNHDHIDDEHPTGLWFEEFAVPYARFCDQGYHVTVASPRGGTVPIDPRSMPDDAESSANREALEALRDTQALDELDIEQFDAVFFPGGHGTMYDMPGNAAVAQLVGRFADEDKVVAAVCHGPAALLDAQRADGTPVVKGHRIAAFTNAEEAAVELDGLMPFLLESRLRELGADVDAAAPWRDHVIVDGRLVTGQNPQSSGSAADAVIRLLSA